MFNRILNNRGSAILIVLGLMAMLTSLALISVDRSNTDIELSYNQLHEERAFYLAEAGLERAVTSINADYSWRDGFVDQALDDGEYTVALIDSTTNAALGDTVVVEATSNVFGSNVTLEAWLVQTQNFPYKYGAYRDLSLSIQNNACTDSYASDSGTYAATQDDINGDVGSNGTVLIKGGSAVVGGDVFSATPGGIAIIGNPTINGDTATGTDPVSMNLVSDADYTYAQAHNSAPTGFVGTGYSYTSGNLQIKAKTISLNSGTYYLNSLTLIDGAKLNVSAGARVKIFINDSLSIQNNSSINSGGVPSNMNIFTRGTKITVGDNASYYGTIYAPNCNLNHSNNAYIYGAVIAKIVNVANNACVHYDRALARSGYSVMSDYQVFAWKQTE